MQIPEEREGFLKMANYSLVKHTDMMAEVRDEAVDICMNAVEKFPSDLSKCTQFIKDSMDKKFGSPWHCVAGKGFSFEVSHEIKNILFVFVAGETGVLIWKC